MHVTLCIFFNSNITFNFPKGGNIRGRGGNIRGRGGGISADGGGISADGGDYPRMGGEYPRILEGSSVNIALERCFADVSDSIHRVIGYRIRKNKLCQQTAKIWQDYESADIPPPFRGYSPPKV